MTAERPVAVLTVAGLHALRGRWTTMRKTAALLDQLGDTDAAKAMGRRAAHLAGARQYVVMLPCLLCQQDTACEVSLRDTAMPEAVICGPCNAATTGEAEGHEPPAGYGPLVVVT